MNHTYTTESELWKWQGENACWHFLTINKKLAEEIKMRTEPGLRGFGSVKVEVTIGNTIWKTSIFPTKEGEFILPVKAAVRKSENLNEGDIVKFTFTTV